MGPVPRTRIALGRRGGVPAGEMESSVADPAALTDPLSPLFLSWLSRDECPPPVHLWIGGASGFRPFPVGPLSRALLTTLCAGSVAIVLLRWWRRKKMKQEDEVCKINGVFCWFFLTALVTYKATPIK